MGLNCGRVKSVRLPREKPQAYTMMRQGKCMYHREQTVSAEDIWPNAVFHIMSLKLTIPALDLILLLTALRCPRDRDQCPRDTSPHLWPL